MYYQRKRQEGKSHSMAVRALANVWVRIIQAMWLKQERYVATTFHAAQQRGVITPARRTGHAACVPALPSHLTQAGLCLREPNDTSCVALEKGRPMGLLDDLRRLAIADQTARRNALLMLLREIDAPFTLSRQCLGPHRPENITVRFQESVGPRLVVGAHYDSVPGSTGANDNGAGVVVLLCWLRLALAHPPRIPLEVVFFDQEERGQVGSRAYLEQAGTENVLAMLNLDSCGVGDTILVAPRHHVEQGPFHQPLQRIASAGACPYQIGDLLPPGDDLTFEQAAIPNISVCMLPWQECEAVIETAQAIHQGRWPSDVPTIWETMHNGRRDSIQTIEEPAMQQLFTWLAEILKHFESAGL